MIFDDLSKKITQTGQDAAQKAKDLAEITRINMQVDAQQKAVNEFCMHLGSKYFELYSDNPDEHLADICAKIKTAVDLIAELKGQIENIKRRKNMSVQTSGETCPNCGNPIAEGAAFCGGCGWKVERSPKSETQDRKICPNCGGALPADSLFCSNCGQKV